MEMHINELGKFLEKLIEKAKTSGFSQVEINEDFYWTLLSTEESFNFNTPNPQIGVGSLEDDYDSLKQMLSTNVSTPLDFERLAHLLLAFSHSVNSSDKPFIC